MNVNCPASEAPAVVDRLSNPDAVNVLFDELDVDGVEPFVFAAAVNPPVEVTLKCCHHTVISSTRPVITKQRRSGARAASPPLVRRNWRRCSKAKRVRQTKTRT